MPSTGKRGRKEKQKKHKKEQKEPTNALAPLHQPRASYDLKKFDPRTMIRPFSTILFAGGRRTGKSFAMRDFMYHMRKKIYDGDIFSGTFEDDYPWERFLPPKYVNFVKEKFPNDILNTILTRQEYRKELARLHKKKLPPSLLVFEDLEYLKPSMWNNQEIRYVMFNGRHINSYVFAAIQYIMEINMALRGMFDGCLFTFEPSVAVRKRIYDQFGGIFPSFEHFEDVFHEVTKDHRCMFLDMRSGSYNVTETVYWYKAEDHGVFRMGVDAIWDDAVDIRNLERLELERRRARDNPDLAQPPPPTTKGKRGRTPVGVNLGD